MSLNTIYPVYKVPDLSVGSYLIIIISENKIYQIVKHSLKKERMKNNEKPRNEIYIKPRKK
jgi:hypothetical protein